jgi:hypothetical protein
MQPLSSPSIREPGCPSVAAQRAIQAEPDGLQLRLNLFSGHSTTMPASNGYRSGGFHLYFPPRSAGSVFAVLFHSPGGNGWVASQVAVGPDRTRTRHCFSRSFRILEVSKRKCSVQATCSKVKEDHLVAFHFAPTTCHTAIDHTFPGNLRISCRRRRSSRLGGARRVGGPRRLHVRRTLPIYLRLSIHPIQWPSRSNMPEQSKS